MRFLLLNQFYPPDVAPTGRYLHEVARTLVARGHSVDVWASRGAYDGGRRFAPHEILDGVHVRRRAAFGFGRRTFSGKLMDYGAYMLGIGAGLHRQRPRPDAVLALTTPPYLGGLARAAAGRRGPPVAHWIMDLYPDVIAAHGTLTPSGWPYRTLQALTRRQLHDAALILSISPDMSQRLAAYAPAGTPTVQIPLWSTLSATDAPPEAVATLRRERGWSPDEVVLMYSGNMGLGHRFGEFLETARRLHGAARWRWVFAGGGKRLPEIHSFKARHPELAIDILPYCPAAQLPVHLAAADVHLVSLDSRWQGGIVPSKLQNTFAIGRPVLFVGPAECSLAQWIREAGGGWHVPENDVPALEAAVRATAAPAERQRRGAAACQFARANFDRDTNIGAICGRLEAAAGTSHG